MDRKVLLISIAAVTASGMALATPATNQPVAQPGDPQKVCKMVASNQPNSRPFEMCLTKTDWEARKVADAKDANRIVCHYEDEPGTRLHNRKICMPASDWDARLQGNREQIEGMQMKTCVPGGGC